LSLTIASDFEFKRILTGLFEFQNQVAYLGACAACAFQLLGRMISTQPSAYSEMISQDDKVPKQDSTPSAGKSPAKRSGLKSKKTAAPAAQATSSSDTTPKAGNTSEAKTANIVSQSLEDGRPNHLAERNDQLRSARREVTQLRERNNSPSAQVEDLSARNKQLDYTLR